MFYPLMQGMFLTPEFAGKLREQSQIHGVHMCKVSGSYYFFEVHVQKLPNFPVL